ncbi:hypothetical protein ACWDOR_40250 [Streptosporangium canum]|uniref:hypothetical protein n=1 Tax=Streptosporangium canum TaxID=324952 RepID=UPI003688675A
MNSVRISLMALMVGVLAGCTYSLETDPVRVAAEEAKTPGSFTEPFPKKFGALDFVSVAPAEEQSKIPDGAHHKVAGKQLTVTYRNDRFSQSFSATGAQAEVTDIKGALDSLTEQAGEPAGAKTGWVPVSPGPPRAAAACQNTDDGTHCYWVDTDTVGYLVLSKEAAPFLPFAKIRVALEGLEDD